MPELPEVEALVGFLRERTSGRLITSVALGQISALKTYAPPLDALVGRRVSDVVRHGKWLDVVAAPAGETDGDPLHLVFHLARGGWLRWSEQAPTTPVRPRAGGGGGNRPTLALRVRFDDGAGFDLTEAGTRKRLAVYVATDPDAVPQIASLGVEPMSDAFTPEVLAELLARKNQQVKGLLRDQGAIAGIGNAYSDEILLVARTSPFRLTKTYAPPPGSAAPSDDVVALHTAIRDVLREAVAASSGRPAAEVKDAKRRGMRVHGRTGEPCPGWDGVPCGDTVHEVSFADRSLQYCPTCQTGGQVLADRRMSRLLR
ncbi:Fpg/Nei family DNA glycosylase [Luteimicrobium sp. DT211]|uniref:Fpg/Nei family DNA glycosylase n=1 Tax=Luteimicrobium sp. DT211 TaxID=3393412 RepID=UPI003CE93AAB